MMLTEAEFRAEVVAQMKWEKFVKQQGDRRGAEATVRRQPGRVRRHAGPRPAHPDDARHRRGQAEGSGRRSSAASSRWSSRRPRRPSPRCPPTADALAEGAGQGDQDRGAVRGLRQGVLGLPVEEGRRRPELLPAGRGDGRAVRQGRVRAQAVRDDRRGRDRVRLPPDPRHRPEAGHAEEVRGR